jgi:hypothetical protein
MLVVAQLVLGCSFGPQYVVYCTIQILFGLLCALGDVLWFCDCYNLGVMHLMLYDYNHRPDPLLRVQTAVVSYFEVLCVVGVSWFSFCTCTLC